MSRQRWVAFGIGAFSWACVSFAQTSPLTESPGTSCPRVISIQFSQSARTKTAATTLEAPPTSKSERLIRIQDHSGSTPETIQARLGRGARTLAMPEQKPNVVVKGDRRTDRPVLEALRLQIAEGDLSLAGIARARRLSESVRFDPTSGSGVNRQIPPPLRNIPRPYQKASFLSGNTVTRGLKELVLHVTDAISARLVASFFPHGAQVRQVDGEAKFEVAVAGPPESLALLHRLVVANDYQISPHLIALAIDPKIEVTHSKIRTFLAGDPQVRDFTTSDEYVVDALGSFMWIETDSRAHAELVRWIFSDRAVVQKHGEGFRVFVGASLDTSAHVYSIQDFLQTSKGILDRRLVERAARTVVAIVSPVQESSEWRAFLRDFVTGEREGATHFVRIDTSSPRIAKRVIALLGENGFSERESPFVIVGVSRTHLTHLEALVDGIRANGFVISSKIVFDAKQFVPLPSTTIVRAPENVDGFVDTFGIASSETERRYELTLNFPTVPQATTATYLLDGRVYRSPDLLQIRLGATESSLAHLQALVRWVQANDTQLLSAEMVRRARSSVAFNSEPMTVLEEKDGKSALDFPPDFATGDTLKGHVDFGVRCPVNNETHARELIAVFKGRAVLELHGTEKPTVLIGVKNGRGAHLRALIVETQAAGGVISTAMVERFLRASTSSNRE